jgi:hypothetical protein
MTVISLISLIRAASQPGLGLAARGLAYLDPGSGSYLLQLLIAGALGFAFAIKMFWGQIRAFFLRILGREEASDTDEKPS